VKARTIRNIREGGPSSSAVQEWVEESEHRFACGDQLIVDQRKDAGTDGGRGTGSFDMRELGRRQLQLDNSQQQYRNCSRCPLRTR